MAAIVRAIAVHIACVKEARNVETCLRSIETEIGNQSVETIGMKHGMNAIDLGVIFLFVAVIRKGRNAFRNWIDSRRDQTACIPGRKKTQRIPHEFRETARVIIGFESLFSARPMTNVD